MAIKIHYAAVCVCKPSSVKPLHVSTTCCCSSNSTRPTAWIHLDETEGVNICGNSLEFSYDDCQQLGWYSSTKETVLHIRLPQPEKNELFEYCRNAATLLQCHFLVILSKDALVLQCHHLVIYSFVLINDVLHYYMQTHFYKTWDACTVIARSTSCSSLTLTRSR